MAKISKNYKPTQKEKFMNAKMKEYFKQKLLSWKNELLKESSQTLNNLQSDNEAKPDITDRASEEIDRSFELRTRDRERKLIKKINSNIVNFDGTDIKVSSSGGVAFSTETETSADLTNKADERLYEAKKDGRNRFKLIDSELVGD